MRRNTDTDTDRNICGNTDAGTDNIANKNMRTNTSLVKHETKIKNNRSR